MLNPRRHKIISNSLFNSGTVQII